MRKIALILSVILLLVSSWATQVIAFEVPLRVVVNGSQVKFPDAQPFIDSNKRTQTPARFIGEALGATVSWDETARKATFVLEGKKLVLFIGKKDYEISGQKKQMDTVALLKEGRTFVPARYVAEAFGATVEWDSAIRTVYISKTQPKKDPVTGWIKEETDVQDVEYSMSIGFSSNPDLRKARYDAAEKIFAERYGDDITKKVFSYVRKKQSRQDTIELTKIPYGDQTISVFGHDTSFEIKVWKKGIKI
ncbi:MAG: copper amine oxidase N-terminal domain-containing protein [Clostridia bacterium]|nr:copper amine oxidase N-terminal domain-containing protein [Clostridia bacterium]